MKSVEVRSSTAVMGTIFMKSANSPPATPVKNPEIMKYLAAFLPEVAIATSSDFGIDIDAKEAIAFAILGYETWRNRPSNLPSATGARRAVILGKITP